MNTLHPSVKYILFLAMLTAVTYGVMGAFVSPVELPGTVLGTVLGLSLFGLIGRKLAKDPFVGFVATSLAVFAMWGVVQLVQ